MTGSQWTAQSAQQLVRYEALFKLLDDIQSQEDIATIARYVSRQWKYFSNVACWRLVIAEENNFLVIDGHRGDVQINHVDTLSSWDEYYWELQLPQLLKATDPNKQPDQPSHLKGSAITEIKVMPFVRGRRQLALLSVGARHEPFNDLDKRFIHLFGGYFVDRIAAISLRQSALEALTNKATYDFLTGLLNRGVVIDRLEHQLIHCQRVGQPLSVVLADVDHFKSINDTYGHIAGDEVLREISKRFQASVRRGEIVGRYGGEEFLFVLYPCDTKALAEATERFQRIVTSTPVRISKDNPKDVWVSLSFGAASTDQAEQETMQSLLKQADDALYRAKACGRNKVIVA